MADIERSNRSEYHSKGRKALKMGRIPMPPPPAPMTNQERDEARFKRQLDAGSRPPGRAESWVRLAFVASVIAALIWAAGII